MAVPEEELENTELSEEQEQAMLLFFKTCVTSKDMTQIKNKLRISVLLRNRLLNDKTINIPEIFPFYFAAPNLVFILKIQLIQIA